MSTEKKAEAIAGGVAAAWNAGPKLPTWARRVVWLLAGVLLVANGVMLTHGAEVRTALFPPPPVPANCTIDPGRVIPCGS